MQFVRLSGDCVLLNHNFDQQSAEWDTVESIDHLVYEKWVTNLGEPKIILLNNLKIIYSKQTIILLIWA